MLVPTRLRDTPAERPAPRPSATPVGAGRPRPLSPWAIVTALSVAALGIRLIIIRGFWLDEATTGYDASQSFSRMLTLLRNDNHPPLHYALMWLVVHAVGPSTLAMRLPSVAFGTATVPMLFLAGRALYGRRAGLVAAAAGTVAPLAVWYAQEARMYALFMLLATVTIWAQARILNDGRRRFWAIWAAAAITMVWTQWFASLAVGTEFLVFGAWVLRGRHAAGGAVRLRRLGASAAAVVAGCAPGIPLLLVQFHNNQANGLGFSGPGGTASTTAVHLSPYGVFNNIVWGLWGYHSDSVIAHCVALWPLGLLLALLALGRRRRYSDLVPLSLIVLPATLVLLASAKASGGRSLFEIRYFIEAVPAMLLLLSGVITGVITNPKLRRVVVALFLATLSLGLVLQQTDGANPRLYGYQTVFDRVLAAASPGDRIVYAPTYLNVDVAFLAPHITAVPVGDAATLPANGKVFLVGSFPFSGSAPAATALQTEEQTLARDRTLLLIEHAPNVTLAEYSAVNR